MALGSDNNGGKKTYDNQYYSRLGFREYEGEKATDKRLGISYRTGMMILDISRAKDGGFEFESLNSVFITGTKAKIFSKAIEEFQRDYEAGLSDTNVGYGINTGMGETQTVAFFHVDNNRNKILTISKIDVNGSVTKTADYKFNNNFHYGLKFNDYSKMDFEREYIEDLEMIQLKEAIDIFGSSANGAAAYFVADLARYDQKAVMNKFNSIFDNLGIERSNGGSSRNGSGGGYFNNNRGGSSEHKNYSDLEDSLPFDED